MITKKEMAFGAIMLFIGAHHLNSVVKSKGQRRVEISARKISEGLNGAQEIGQNINLDIFATGEEIVKRAYEPLPGPKGTVKLRLDPPVPGVEKLLEYDGEKNMVVVLPYIPPR